MKHIRKFNEEIGDPRDQETLEEASENYAIDKQNDTGSKYYIALESFQEGAKWQSERSRQSTEKTNEGFFSKKEKDTKLEEINLKISDAAYSLKSFGTTNKQGAFINGAKWAVQNLTDEEIKYLRENGDKEDSSLFGF